MGIESEQFVELPTTSLLRFLREEMDIPLRLIFGLLESSSTLYLLENLHLKQTMSKLLIRKSSKTTILFLKIQKFHHKQKILSLKFWLLILKNDLLWIRFLSMNFSIWVKLFQNLCLIILLPVPRQKITSNNLCQILDQIQPELQKILTILVKLLPMDFSQLEVRKTSWRKVQKKSKSNQPN